MVLGLGDGASGGEEGGVGGDIYICKKRKACLCLLTKLSFRSIDMKHARRSCRMNRHPRERRKKTLDSHSHKLRYRHVHCERSTQATTDACGVLMHVAPGSVSSEHGGGTLGSTGVASLRLPSIMNLCTLHITRCVFHSPAKLRVLRS